MGMVLRGLPNERPYQPRVQLGFENFLLIYSTWSASLFYIAFWCGKCSFSKKYSIPRYFLLCAVIPLFVAFVICCRSGNSVGPADPEKSRRWSRKEMRKTA